MHALIIEDELLIALSIEDTLSDWGFITFDLVTSMAEALVAVARKCPDLITADVELNPGSGIDVVDAICSRNPIPVIFITGSPTEVIRRMPQHLLLMKPFEEDQLVRAVETLLAPTQK